MKRLTVLLSLTLALAPVGLAQDDCNGRDCQASDKPQDGDDAQHGNETAKENRQNDKQEKQDRQAPGNSDRAKQFCRQNPDADMCHTDDGHDLSRLGHVAFTVDRQHHLIEDMAVGNRTIFDVIILPGPFEAAKHGNVLSLKGDGWVLRIHDNPTGLLSYQGNQTLELQPPADVPVTAADHGAILSYGNHKAHLTGPHVAIGDGSILVEGQAKFHVPPRQAGNADRHEITDAISDRRVGAEVIVRRDVRESYAYDDMEVTVESPDQITATDVMRVVVSAELDEGRTVVLDVDPDMLTGPDLELRYYDVWDDGNETEVVFRQAGSLADVLDATDDGGQPEYWVVEDADGLQVLVSVPHWSTHAITIASIGEFVTQPSVLIGIGAGVAGVGVAALAMFRGRRD